MKVIKALLWIWPLPYELSTEQLKWKWELAHNLPQGRFLLFSRQGAKEKENVTLIIQLTHTMPDSRRACTSQIDASIWGWRCHFSTNGYWRRTNSLHISVCPINQKVRGQHINRAVSKRSEVNRAWSRTWGQMCWSLLRGLFSQPSRPWRWSIWGLGDSSLQTITQSHSTPATDTPWLPVVPQSTDDTLPFSVHLIWVIPSYFSGEIITPHQATGQVCKQYKWECWQMLHIYKVAVLYQSSLTVLVAVLCCVMLFFFFVRGN